MNEPKKVESKTANSDAEHSSTVEHGGDMQTNSTGEAAKIVNELTPEEQMALYEKELKENDWGHQPC